jgi:lipoprotein-anchoring transpeptidase ErfK/SrfK
MRFVFIFIMLISISLSGFANPEGTRDKTRTLADTLLKEGAMERFPDEYQNLLETISVGEALIASGERAEAEKIFLLARVKCSIINDKLAMAKTSEQVPHSGTQQPAIPEKIQTPMPAIPSPTESREPSPPSPSPALPLPFSEEKPILPQYNSEFLTGGEQWYTVKKGESLRLVATRFGIPTTQLARDNAIDMKNPRINTGQQLKVNNLKIVPIRLAKGIIINIPDRTLYYFKDGKLNLTAPITLGKPGKKENGKYNGKWDTPTGKFTIVSKITDPTWHVPKSIQEEMEDDGKDVITMVPPGDKNPLGKYALLTSIPGILIHSTNTPLSIYGFNSHGCIRVYPERMERLFRAITVKSKGEIIYKPVKVALLKNGQVFLEVNRDVYNKAGNLLEETRKLIMKEKAEDLVDWIKVRQIVLKKSGIAEDVTNYPVRSAYAGGM